jgi:hypothetical protein
MVLIGTFQNEQDAQKIERLFAEMEAVATEENQAGRLSSDWDNTKFSDQLMEFFRKENIWDFGHNDPAIFLYEHRVRRAGEQLIVTTEETEFSAFLKLMLKGSAKIEVYSAHDYPGRYGRGR